MCGFAGQSNVDEYSRKQKKKDVARITYQFKKHGLGSRPIAFGVGGKAMIGSSTEVFEAKYGFNKGKNKFGKDVFWFNARAEFWGNKSNDTNYEGPFHLLDNKHLKDLLKTNRIVIPVSHFFEQPESDSGKAAKDKKRHLIRKQEDEIIYLGGIMYEEEGERSFCIITTPATGITKAVDHPRSPVILSEETVDEFLNPELKLDELEQFFKPADTSDFMAFEVPNYTINPNWAENDLFNPVNLPEELGEVEIIGEVIYSVDD